MEPHVQELMLSELRAQMNAAVFAYLNIGVALDERQALVRAQPLDTEGASAAHQRAWFYVDATLSAMTHVANLVWPSPKAQDPDTSGRGKALRDLLGLGENDALDIRRVRNGFEHYDERVDKWARKSKASNFVDREIGPRSSYAFAADEDIARLFDVTSGEVIVFGTSCNLRTAIGELGTLNKRVEALSS